MTAVGGAQALQVTQDPATWSTAALLGDFQQIAECVRAANHLTLNDRTGILEDPHDAVRLIEHLEAVAERLPQLLDQIAQTLELARGKGVIDAGDEPLGSDAALASFRGHLEQAAAFFAQGQTALWGARTAIARLHPAGTEEYED